MDILTPSFRTHARTTRKPASTYEASWSETGPLQKIVHMVSDRTVSRNSSLRLRHKSRPGAFHQASWSETEPHYPMVSWQSIGRAPLKIFLLLFSTTVVLVVVDSKKRCPRRITNHHNLAISVHQHSVELKGMSPDGLGNRTCNKFCLFGKLDA